tara:strand:+ start:505 stop:1149 length:645 start_codon:yes stop_codon:yes gene_type:complete
MKLLLDGKQRNIYFRKDNTAYYKKNGIENDITDFFKKTGELKKTYSNLLVKSETVNNVKKKKKKIITGGATLDIFDLIEISFEKDTKCLTTKALQQLCEHLIYIIIIVKIQFDINGNNPFNMAYKNLPKYLNLIIAIMKNLFASNITLLGNTDKNIDKNIEAIKKNITNLSYDSIFTKIEYVKKLTKSDEDCGDESIYGYGIVAALTKAKIFES